MSLLSKVWLISAFYILLELRIVLTLLKPNMFKINTLLLGIMITVVCLKCFARPDLTLFHFVSYNVVTC